MGLYTSIAAKTKTTLARNVVHAVSGAVLLSLTLSTAASALTIAQTAQTGTSATATRGQTFTVNNSGGSLSLQSFAFGYLNSSARTASSLYIYTSLPTVAQLNTGTGALYTSTSFSDSSGADPQFSPGVLSRTFNFTGASLSDGTYYAMLSALQDTALVNPDTYPGGVFIYGSPTSVLPLNNLDATFVAELNTAVPVPFAFNPVFGLAGVGLLRACKAMLNRRPTKKTIINA